MNPDDLTVAPDLCEEVQIRLLKSKVERLEIQLAKTDQALEIAQEKASKYDNLEKGLSLLQRWAEEKGDEFAIDLIDLIN